MAMLQAIERISASESPYAASDDVDGVLTLTFAARQRSRLRGKLDDGTEVALWMPRGTVLRGGDRLLTACGRSILVRAAAESVSIARSGDPQQIARACYHLGNRHVAVEILRDGVRYLHDHVLDTMLRGLGFDAEAEHAPFEPEDGAYRGGHGHAHGATHGHGAPLHAHDDDHPDDPDHAHAHGPAHAHGDRGCDTRESEHGDLHAHARELGHRRAR